MGVGDHGKGLRLLALDGGGIRGLSELFILQEIMNRIQDLEDLEDVPLPCEYFDIIGGTSTGGLIALMLGRLRMSVKGAIECYASLAEDVFSRRKLYGEGKYKASRLEAIVKQIVRAHTPNNNPLERIMDERADDVVCKVFVCAKPAESAGAPRLFRTYRVGENESMNCTIWEAARATSAAPTFFKSIEITEDGLKERFIDGGIGNNNPVRLVLQEAERSFPDRHVACVISIGTGKMSPIDIPRQNLFQRWIPLDIINALKEIATECEQTAEEIHLRFKKYPNIYYRFNVEQGMQHIDMARWESMGTVKTHTLHYLGGVDVNEKVNRAARTIQERDGRVPVETLGS